MATKNYIWLGLKILEAIENYIRLSLEYFKWLRTLFGLVWNSKGKWELYSVRSGILKETENYIRLNLEF